MKFKPLGDRILVAVAEQPETVKGGIVIPENAREKPSQGEAIAVGPAVAHVKRGDQVLLPKYGGSEIRLDGKAYQLVREEDVLGVLE